MSAETFDVRISRVRWKDADKGVRFSGTTTLDLDPTHVLAAALERGLTEVVVLGYDGDGDEYFASSKSDGGDVLWLLAMAQKNLLDVVERLKRG